MHPEFPPIAIIAAVSLLLPLPWHWRAKNIATLSIIAWLFAVNIIYAVDAIVWGDNVRLVLTTWCDITTKLLIGSNFALPAACLCISVHLEQVASVRSARSSLMDKRRRQIFEGCMCLGLPIVFMALHYVVQGHRYDVIEEYGCRPTTYISVPGILIVYVPTLVMATASLIFSSLALRHLMKRRLTFALHLQNSNSALSTSRYMRLMLMAFFQMVTSITITSLNLWFTLIAVPIRPWTDWHDVHSDFLRIDQYLTAFTPPLVVKSFYALWWTVPLATFIFVVFFAFGKEAMDEYKQCLFWVQRNIFRYKPMDGTSSKSKSSFLQRFPQKLTFPISLRSKATDTTGSTSTDVSLPTYKYPKPPAPPRYQSNLEDTDCSDSRSEYSSQYKFAPSTSSVYQADLDSHPLPPTPSTYAPTTTTAYAPYSPTFPEGIRANVEEVREAASPSPVPNSRAATPRPQFNDRYEAQSSTTQRPPSPFPAPPPSQPRVRPQPVDSGAGPQSSASSRPLTYPSFDAFQRGFSSSFLPSAQS
ncbi:hypothetical protein HGRIS_007132 [Hohenbuehelia grisea]|uniref:Pheromone receptor n=1 Tax=Hohenbuehelia grisea TaxID=104357 RepID=A0ABR3JBF8_9AGAR